jgi:hypothetical protein
MSFFGEVKHIIVDGAAGLAPSGNPLAIVAGVCDAGVIGAAVPFGKESDPADFGVGPLVERLRDVQSEGDGGLNVIAVRITQTTAGVIGAVTKTGTGSGAQATAGTAKRFAQVVVLATSAGANGVAQVQYSLDGGLLFSLPETIPANGHVVLGDSGVELDFTNAGTPANSVAVGDKWTFYVLEPRSTMAQALTDIAAALAIYHPSIVYLVGQSAAADWTAAAQEASDLFDEAYPTWFLMESVLPDLPTAQTMAAWVTALSAETFGDLWVSVCAAYGRRTDPVNAEQNRRNGAGLNLGRIARIGVQASIGRTADGPLTGVDLMDGFNNVHAKTLDDKGYTVFRAWAGLSGVYFSNGRMKASVGSDYQFQEIVRVVHKAVRETRAEMLLFAGMDLDADRLGQLKANSERPLDRMMRAAEPEILGYTLTIPEGQDIVNDGLSYTLDLEGVPIVRKLKAFVRFKFAKVV